MAKHVWKILAGLLVVLAAYLGTRATGSKRVVDGTPRAALSRDAMPRPQYHTTQDAPPPSKLLRRPVSEVPEPSDGKKQGLESEWFANGGKAWERNYDNGQPEGTWTSWHENGNMREESQFKYGKQEGLMTSWHSNGMKWREARYKQGRLHGPMVIWDQDGNRISTIIYKDGKPVPQGGKPVGEEE